MNKKLNEIATIQMGFSFRSKLNQNEKGNVSIIQMKDFADGNLINCDYLLKIKDSKIKDSHLVKDKDIIFKSRGLSIESAIALNISGKVIVAAPLFRIRVNDANNILPEYLNWYISQGNAQSFFRRMTEGSALKMVNKKSLGDLEVEIPSLEKQKQIIELSTLANKEDAIMKELLNKKKKYISKILLNYATGE